MNVHMGNLGTNLFPAAMVIAFLFCPVLLPAATTTGESCADLSTAFDDRLEAELDFFEDWITGTSPTDKHVQWVETLMAGIKRQLCELLKNKEIESTHAVKGLRVWRTTITMGCANDVGEVEFDNIGGFLGLSLHSAASFCNKIVQLRERHEGIMGYFLEDAIKAYERFQEEGVCAQQDLVKMLFPPFFSEHIVDFPPYVQILSELESICDKVKIRDIEFEDAWHEVERAKIRLGGGPQLAFAWTHHIMKKYYGILAWPALIYALFSALTFAVCLPLYIVFSILSRLDSTRYIWDDGRELFAMGMGISCINFGVLIAVAYVDSVLSFLQVVAVLITIVATVIGAFVGLKKLAGK